MNPQQLLVATEKAVSTEIKKDKDLYDTHLMVYVGCKSSYSVSIPSGTDHV